jgi:hypothetical protein
MIQLIVLLIIVGLVMYLVNNYLPIDPPFKMVINVLVILCLILYLLSAFGIVGPDFPRLR